MSLYGLDIIVDKNGRNNIIQINGVNAGLAEFEQIYGDNRIAQKAFRELEEMHGKLTVNDGSYFRNQFRKKHPILYFAGKALSKIKSIDRLAFGPTINSQKAESSWLDENITLPDFMEKAKQLPFEIYNGQESTIINYQNGIFNHPTINSFDNEQMTRNKFLQYMLLKDTLLGKDMPKSTLVGIGITNEEDLEEMALSHKKFSVRPILGTMGRGVKFPDNEDLLNKYHNTRGPVNDPKILDSFAMILGRNPCLEYVEDLAKKEDYSFQFSIALVQPFIESEIFNDHKYSTIRAIVCNGKFIDAYNKVSKNPNASIFHGAKIIPFEYDKNFGAYCENAIKIFEEESIIGYKNAVELFYEEYFVKRERTTQSQKDQDARRPIMEMFEAGLQMYTGRDII